MSVARRSDQLAVGQRTETDKTGDGVRVQPVERWSTWLLALLLATSAALAQDLLPVPALSSRVIDQTATLEPQQTAALAARLARFESERGAQIVVLMVPTTAPEDIAAYAQRVGDTWKIGRRGVGDGLLLVVAKDDRTVRIEVAKALEGAVPDLAARQIIDRVIVPAFRNGDFAGGLNGALNPIFSRIRGETPAPEVSGEAISWGFAAGVLLMLAFFAAIGIDVSRLHGSEPGWVGKLSMAVAGGWALWFMFGGVLLALVGAVGLPFLALWFAKVFRRLGRNDNGGIVGGNDTVGGGWSGGDSGGSSTIGSSNDSSSSGVTSGGGGDFGGGGASGKW